MAGLRLAFCVYCVKRNSVKKQLKMEKSLSDSKIQQSGVLTTGSEFPPWNVKLRAWERNGKGKQKISNWSLKRFL